MTSFSTNIKSMLTRRIVLVVGLMMLSTLASSACAVQESNTYPVEIFSEMHYSQAFKEQEPPRLAPPADSVVFKTAGDSSETYNVPDKQERTYDPAIAGNLYRVNCSVCHGVSGLGDGKAVRHITSSSSFYATKEGTPYKSPPNLVDSAASRLNQREVMFSFISGWNGPVMPAFGKLLAEEDIRDIVNYIFDDTTGLSK
jgi:mono/diheme cytochrome c family protein|tara:strand:+ start:8263 stop:8859 length:597 start_codon:yes stop_codon:yes gene_type:complete